MPAHSPPNSTEYTLLPRQICWVDIENLASGKSCQISNPSAASSSFSVAPSNLRRFETVMDRETFARLQCRRDGIPSTMNFNRRVRDRSVDIGSSEFSRYSENRGLNQQFGSTGSNVNGESTMFLHHPVSHYQYFSFHYPLLPLERNGAPNMNFQTQQAAYPRIPRNNVSRYGSMNNLSDASINRQHGYVGSIQPNGIRIYRPRGELTDANQGHHNFPLPQLTVMQVDEVVIMEMPPFSEVRNSNNRNRDMRLDIDNMSYEELLTLGERIGNISTGLTEDIIGHHLKTRICLVESSVGPKRSPCLNQENNFCIICQADYENNENIGTLDCGHEYHAECLKQWLLLKNICPLCKSAALTIEI